MTFAIWLDWNLALPQISLRTIKIVFKISQVEGDPFPLTLSTSQRCKYLLKRATFSGSFEPTVKPFSRPNPINLS